MIGLKIWLTLAAATYSTAFVPTYLRDARSLPPRASVDLSSTSEATSDAVVVFPGVHLPEGNVPPSLFNDGIKAQVGEFLDSVVPKLDGIVGKPKSDGLAPIQKVCIDVILSKYTLPKEPNYEQFGDNGENSKILENLLKVDTFFASALTKTKHGFELKAFDPKDPDCTKNPTMYREIVSTLQGCGHRVNFQFNKEMEVTGYEVFDDVMGTEISQKGKKDIDFWAGSALYNTLFYASAVHATIHVLHYLTTSAFQFVSQDFDPMHQWAKTYANNVQNKYNQVSFLLIQPPPDLGAGNAVPMVALITGSLGFGSQSEYIIPILARLLNTWGENPSAEAWFESMMNISPKDMDEAGILTEFRKHFDLLTPFSEEVAKAFKEIDPEKTESAECDLVDYLKKCGSFSSNINSLEDWIQLMGATGAMHGSTLGYTRLGAMSDVMQWRDIQNPNWEPIGVRLCSTLMATIVGMEEGNHVMTSTYKAPFDPTLQAVLDKFDTETTDLKKDYEAKIQLDPDFAGYGWILSEFCTDGFDGKQLTTNAYI